MWVSCWFNFDRVQYVVVLDSIQKQRFSITHLLLTSFCYINQFMQMLCDQVPHNGNHSRNGNGSINSAASGREIKLLRPGSISAALHLACKISPLIPRSVRMMGPIREWDVWFSHPVCGPFNITLWLMASDFSGHPDDVNRPILNRMGTP